MMKIEINGMKERMRENIETAGKQRDQITERERERESLFLAFLPISCHLDELQFFLIRGVHYIIKCHSTLAHISHLEITAVFP